MTERPRVLFVGRARYSLPLPGWLAKKWDAVEQELDYRVIGAATAESGRAMTASGLRAPRRRVSSTASSSTSGCRCDCGARFGASGRRRSSRPIPFSARRRSPVERSPAGGCL